MPYIHQFLQDQSFSKDASELNKIQIIAEVNRFVLEDEVFFRKMKKEIMAFYIEFQFHEDLM